MGSFLLILCSFPNIDLSHGFISCRKPLEILLEEGCQAPQSQCQLLDVSEAHGEGTRLEGDVRRQPGQPGVDVSRNQVAQFPPHSWRFSLGPDRLEFRGRIAGLDQAPQKPRKRFALDQQGFADADGGKKIHEHLGGTGLDLEKALDLARGVVRAD